MDIATILEHSRLQDRKTIVTVAAAIVVMCISIAFFCPALVATSVFAEKSEETEISGLKPIEEGNIREWVDGDGNYYQVDYISDDGQAYHIEDEDGNRYVFYPNQANAGTVTPPDDDSWRRETWDEYEQREAEEAEEANADYDVAPLGSIDQYYRMVVENTVGTPTTYYLPNETVTTYGHPLYDSVIGPGGLSTTIMQYVKGIAAALLIVYILLGVIREAQKGTANPDLFWKVLVRMALTIVLLIYLEDLINGLQYVLQQMIGRFSSMLQAYINTKAPQSYTFSANPDGMTFFRRLIWTAVNFLTFWPLWLILVIIVRVRALTYLFELGIRKVFMPLAVLNIMEGTDRGLGLRYIKKYFATYIKIMITILAFGTAVIFSRLEALGMEERGSFIATSLGGIFKYYAFSTFLVFVALSVSRKGEKIADEVMGVSATP